MPVGGELAINPGGEGTYVRQKGRQGKEARQTLALASPAAAAGRQASVKTFTGHWLTEHTSRSGHKKPALAWWLRAAIALRCLTLNQRGLNDWRHPLRGLDCCPFSAWKGS